MPVEKCNQFTFEPLSDELLFLNICLGKDSKLLNYLYSLIFFFNLLLITSKQCQLSIVFLSCLCHSCQNKSSVEKNEKKPLLETLVMRKEVIGASLASTI